MISQIIGIGLIPPHSSYDAALLLEIRSRAYFASVEKYLVAENCTWLVAAINAGHSALNQPHVHSDQRETGGAAGAKFFV